MLVLNRKLGEQIVIDLRAFGLEPVLLTVVEFGRGKVRLGVEADVLVPVWRAEIFNRGSSGDLKRDQ